MKKLNLTEGEWRFSQYAGLGSIKVGKKDVLNMNDYSREQVKANANAILTAVNNTYKKGIDPEAVEDMRDALLCFVRSKAGPTDCANKARKALKKAGVENA